MSNEPDSAASERAGERHGQQVAASDRLVAIGYLALLVFAWGGNYTWVKIAVRDIDPLYFNAFRYGAAAVILVVAFAAMGRARDVVPVRGERIELAVIGLLQAGLMTTLTAFALQWIEAGRVVLIAYSMPIWALLWSRLLLAEAITLPAFAGTLMGLAGLVVLTEPHTMRWEGGMVAGIILSVLAVNAWALGSVLYRRHAWASSFWQQVFWQIAATAVAMALLAPLFEDIRTIRATPAMITITIYNAIVPILVGFYFWTQALSRITASAASQVLVLSPVFGMIQSHYVLGEPLGLGIWSASALIAGGAWLTLATQRR